MKFRKRWRRRTCSLEEMQAVVLKLAAFVDGVNGNGTVASDAAASSLAEGFERVLHFLLAKSDGYSPECLFAAENDADVTNIFAILGNILTTEVEASARSDIARLITGHAVNGTDRSVVRLRVLTALFNTLQEPRGRFDVFLALLQFATETDQVGLISNFSRTWIPTSKAGAWTPRKCSPRRLTQLQGPTAGEKGWGRAGHAPEVPADL